MSMKNGAKLIVLSIVLPVLAGAGLVFCVVVLPVALQARREVARREQTANSLKQLSAALEQYRKQGTERPASSLDHEAKSLPNPVQNLKLREELLARMAEDQEARKHLLDLMGHPAGLKDADKQIELEKSKLRDIDGRNLVRLKEIVRHFGWPGQNLVGSDGSQAAWLLVQHADSELAFQKQCLALIVVAVKKGESPPEHMAYLTDRVRVAERQKQVYGTQFHDVNGKLEPNPIEGEADLDRRRREVGLPPMADYRKSIEKMYRPGT
jgi:hypothetical protein